MELRMLGRSGLKVSPLCLGGNVFGWTIDEKQSFELLTRIMHDAENFAGTLAESGRFT
jgi:aryl-alcohol dehydrogenase-like predicted oxidoreductase